MLTFRALCHPDTLTQCLIVLIVIHLIILSGIARMGFLWLWDRIKIEPLYAFWKKLEKALLSPFAWLWDRVKSSILNVLGLLKTLTWKRIEEALLSSVSLWVFLVITLVCFFTPLLFPTLQGDFVNRFYSTSNTPTWVKVPKEDSANLNLYFRLLDELRQRFLALGIGVIGIRTLILSLHRFEQTRAEFAQTKAEFEQSKKEERNKRFHEATKLLGEGTSDVRIGGLISLEQLIKEDPTTMGERIVNLLVSFINNRGQYASKTDTESYFHPLAVAQREAEENGRTLTKEEIKSLQATSQAELGFTPSHPPYEDIKLAFQILAERDLSEAIEAKLDFDFPNIDHSLFHAPTWNLHGVYTGSKKLNRARIKSFVKANLQGANLRKANLQEANLQRANLQRAHLQMAELQMANFQEAYLKGAHLTGADLRIADLRKANLQEAYLPEANLQGANLRETNLQGAKLQEAELQGAYLRETNLQGAYLRETNLQGADLTGAFYGWDKDGKQIPLTAENLIDRGIEWDEKTIFPDGEGYDSDGKPIG